MSIAINVVGILAVWLCGFLSGFFVSRHGVDRKSEEISEKYIKAKAEYADLMEKHVDLLQYQSRMREEQLEVYKDVRRMLEIMVDNLKKKPDKKEDR